MSERLLREWVRGLLQEQRAFRDTAIVDRLKAMGYTNLKPISGLTLAVLLDDGSARSRQAAMSAIEAEFADLGAEWDRTPKAASSLGAVKIGPATIMAKPATRQGRSSGGLDNEDSMAAAVRDAIAAAGGDPITVQFVGENKTFTAVGVSGVVDAGSDTLGRKKADVVLTGPSAKYPISIKKDNAQYWESADRYWGKDAAEYIERVSATGEIEMVDKGGYYNVVPNFAVKANQSEAEAVVFGSDILNQGAVVKRTFMPSDFQFDADEGVLTVQVSYVATDINDIAGTSMDVWFLVRNDKTRRSVPGYNGIRVLAAYEKRINANVLRVE